MKITKANLQESLEKTSAASFFFSLKKVKPIAGYRFFHCSDCENHWKEKSRDCKSPSDETCPKCGELSHPFNSEEHPEWPLDKSGNLI